MSVSPAKESLGRKLGDIVQELKDIRDEIAHGLLDNEEERKVVLIDDAIEVQKVYKWLDSCVLHR